MADSLPSPSTLDRMGAVVAAVAMAVYAFTVICPYFLDPGTNAEKLEIIRSNKNTVDMVTMAVVMFFFGASVGRKQEQETLNTVARTAAVQAETAQVANAALAPVAGAAGATALDIPAGGTASVEAKPDGGVSVAADIPPGKI